MNLEQVYKNKLNVINTGFNLCYQKIKKDIEADPDFTLSDDELVELILDLINYHLNPNDRKPTPNLAQCQCGSTDFEVEETIVQYGKMNAKGGIDLDHDNTNSLGINRIACGLCEKEYNRNEIGLIK